MKYLYLLSFFLVLLAIGIYYISTEVIRPFGQAISKVILPRRLLPNIDYVVLNKEIYNNNLLITIKFFGNVSDNFCIEDIKVNNISKDFDYYSILKDVYRIEIKDTKNYEIFQIRLCNGFFIEE